jgi:DNA-binding transcriptional MerR regulator
MNELIKISELSNKYSITTKTLRYYEAMGIIQSHRTNDYAYRMYDDEAVKRLEQILILRRLGISIKDIKHIFDTTGAEVVLEVLGKKVYDIDYEVALLHELKNIVLKFIVQIKQADFSKDSDVKMLYEKATEIEGQIANTDDAVDLVRLVEVSDKLAEKAEERVLAANDVLALKNFRKAEGQLNFVIQQIEDFCDPYHNRNTTNWVWNSPELKDVKWQGMKDVIHACEETARLTAEISTALGESRGEFEDVFKAVSPALPEVQEFSLEDLASYIVSFKSSIEVARTIITGEREAHFDYILESASEEAVNEIRKSMKSMASLCKDIAAVMAEIGAVIDDPDSKLNNSLPAGDAAKAE